MTVGQSFGVGASGSGRRLLGALRSVVEAGLPAVNGDRAGCAVRAWGRGHPSLLRFGVAAAAGPGLQRELLVRGLELCDPFLPFVGVAAGFDGECVYFALGGGPSVPWLSIERRMKEVAKRC